MRSFLTIACVACIVLSGCQGKKARLAQLNAQYKTANRQYVNDCIAPNQGGTDSYFKSTKPKVASPQEEAAHNQKCAQELKQVTAIEQQIAALSN